MTKNRVQVIGLLAEQDIAETTRRLPAPSAGADAASLTIGSVFSLPALEPDHLGQIRI